ncbi:sporulation integral membrane protein YtvI [Alkalibacillus haloalkaliphilus]|uniref:sporulation integral membrane protein YtvI n=1 Tax=Alkalibacillus haloalkaliphilus TaxID=94136 RepID=UPI002935AF60|nr:sporulation integral membrane protein YtvI [Alkalibacillus haloalkaliphilus]MDV2582509.1 sporulation integral membrane protein YtvI [Alkalibacillus haloalkaliphilus]
MLKNISKKQWTIIFTIIILIVVGYFILPISIPLILAFFTALFLNPVIRWFMRRFRMNRTIAVTIVFLIFLSIIATIGTYTTTKAIGQVVKITENAPEYIKNVETILIELQDDINAFTEDWPAHFVREVEETAAENLVSLETQIMDYIQIDNIAQFILKIPEFLISFIVYMIALFLFMLDLPNLRNKMYSMMTDQTQEKFKFMNARLAYVLLGFLKAQFLVSLIIFTVTLISLLFITPEIALIMSIIIWAVDLIPIIGSIIVLAPWSIYMFLVGDMLMGIQLGVLAIVLLTIRRTIEPKVMGHHIGLKPLPTLIAMYIGLQLIGILGFFLGPIVVIIFNSAREAGIIKWRVKF